MNVVRTDLYHCIIKGLVTSIEPLFVPIKSPPKVGQLLLCDFEPGFKEPEMTKTSRPVIVLSAKSGLVTVVACSTVAPDKPQAHHYKLPRQSMPKTGHFMGRDSWVKGDMVYTVGFHRLNLVQTGKGMGGKRLYFTDALGRGQMSQIRQCVLYGIGMGFLAKHIVDND
ncbi:MULTISPECIES: type II toxin-antitoxin system PemK/MazF family toxin [Aeromonas]|uniref:type II toxin-antitoxin system PemK/MazF family toxin n=1 Tax=Aeromonas TaxID=642 RepID=UPI0039B734AC